jgi:hypothetical protein
VLALRHGQIILVNKVVNEKKMEKGWRRRKKTYMYVSLGCMIFITNVFGYILGCLFAEASGHPDSGANKITAEEKNIFEDFFVVISIGFRCF